MLPSHADVRDPQTYAIIGAAMEVHSHLGCGLLEAVYHDALLIELTARGIPWLREVEFPIDYKGQRLPARYRADFICFGDVIVELKALRELTGSEVAQVLNYLKASGLSRALLLNSGTTRLTCHRYAGSIRPSV